MIRLKQSKMAISDVGVTSLVATMGRAFTQGNLVVVGAYTAATTDVVTSIVDAQNTWTKIGAGQRIGVAGAGFMALYYCANVVGLHNPAVTMTLTSNACMLFVAEWEGIVKSSPLDVSTYASGNGTAVSSGATSATTTDRQLVVGFGASDFGGTAYTLGTGYTDRIYQGSGNEGALESKIILASAAQTATFTTADVTDWACGVATFKAAPDSSKFNNRGLRPHPFSPGQAR